MNFQITWVGMEKWAVYFQIVWVGMEHLFPNYAGRHRGNGEMVDPRCEVRDLLSKFRVRWPYFVGVSLSKKCMGDLAIFSNWDLAGSG